MRTFSTTQEDILKSAKYDVHLLVEVENSTGLLKSVSSLDGDWVESVSWDQDLDKIVPEATIRLRRDVTDGRSLAPLDEASTFNVTEAGSTAALIDAGRLVRIYTATLAANSAAPATSQYDRMFDGEIDEVKWGKSPLEIVARSFIMATLNDRWIEIEATYGSETGVAIETVMQQILDAASLGITLYVPTSPGFLVTTYKQQQMSILQALQTLAQLIGYDVREVWDDATSAFRLTLFEPNRTASTDQWTFNQSQYHDVKQLSISRRDIRNAVSVLYTSTSSGERASVLVESTSSQDRFGRRWMEMSEGADSPIASSSEATTFAQAALDDLKDPAAIQEIETPYWWPGDIQDLIGFTANGIHYSTDQQFGVYGIRHQLSRNKHRTFLRVRGKPAGQYLGWLVNHRDRGRGVLSGQGGGSASGGRGTGVRLLNFRRTDDSTAGTATFLWNWAGEVKTVWIYEETVGSTSATDDTFAGFGSRLPGTILDRDLDPSTYTVTFPTTGSIIALEFQCRDELGQPGAVIRLVVGDTSPVDGSADITFSGANKSTVYDYGDKGAAFNIESSNGNRQKAKLTASATLTLNGFSEGQPVEFLLEYGGVFTPTFAGVEWVGGSAPTPASVNGDADLYYFVHYGGTTIGMGAGQAISPFTA